MPSGTRPRFENEAKLRNVAAKSRKLLIQHSKVSPDQPRVRLGEFGDLAFLLGVFAFVRAADWNEFLAIKEDLNLRAAEIFRDLWTSFAVPSQTIYFTRDGSVDAVHGQAMEAEVRQWREERRLPFLEYDFTERAEMADTIAFPPEGSPDYRPNPPRQVTPQQTLSGEKRGWLVLLGRRKELAFTA
jgi:MscS family membrane protein